MAGRECFALRPQLWLAVSVAALVAACSNSGGEAPRSRLNRPAFTEEEYGVKTSTRVSESRGTMRKGGGSFKLGSPYKVAGRWYVPREEPGYDRSGTGSWYGDDFHGRKTANGEIFDMHALTAAHPTLPLPSYAYVTNMQNGRTILVRVNDRGPYVRDRIIDLSHASARALGYDAKGHAPVRVRYAGRAPMNGDDRRERQYLASQPWSRGGGVQIAAAAPYDDRPYSPPPPVPATRPDRWSAANYRADIAGKAVPSGFADGGARRVVPSAALAPAGPRQRYAAAPAYEPPRTYEPARAPETPRGGGERLVWQTSPRGEPIERTGSTERTEPRAALGGAALADPGAGMAYVQVGTYADRFRADRMRASFGHLGPVEVAPVQIGSETYYRVRIGPMNAGDARQALAEISREGVSGGTLVTAQY